MNIINIFVQFNVKFLWKVHYGYIKGVNICHFFPLHFFFKMFNKDKEKNLSKVKFTKGLKKNLSITKKFQIYDWVIIPS
jgi:hypothetical protein